MARVKDAGGRVAVQAARETASPRRGADRDGAPTRASAGSTTGSAAAGCSAPAAGVPADLLAEVSLELRGATGGAVRPLAPSGAPAAGAEQAEQPAAAEPVAEPALALVGAPARSALRRG